MSKPTMFFSHSSKDHDSIGAIKNKLDSITGGVLDIFLSSDGQSIPFGSNWVHKIEGGLEKASIMFVFITPNSITSNWIYFESGFAYSKNIQVIPVGIGIDIALLKAPLNLLQGFNISSGDGLNNFVTIINDKFDYHFKEDFSNDDYRNIINHQDKSFGNFKFTKIFEFVYHDLLSEYWDGKGGKITYDVEKFFESIKSYLIENNINFSYQSSYNNQNILVYGIKIVCTLNNNDTNKIVFTISPYNFGKSFNLFIQLIQLIKAGKFVNFNFSLKNGYEIIVRQEHLASVMSMYPDEFEFVEDCVGTFSYKGKNIMFSIFNSNAWDRQMKARYVLSVSFMPSKVCYQDIAELIYSLVNKKVIYKL